MARVLVVDDTADLRMLFAAELRYHGHTPVEAASGADAVDLIRTSRPDVVILDMGLPDMGGLSVLQELREEHGASMPPVVVLTAFQSDEVRDRAMAAGATAYLTKVQTSAEDLMHEIDRALGVRPEDEPTAHS